MPLIQNLRRKSFKSMILLGAITLGTAVATDALAAGHGGGGGLGGGHIGGGVGDGHAGGGFGGGGFGGGHIGVGIVGGRMAGNHLGGGGEAFLGNRGWSYHQGTRMGGFHDRDHHHSRERFVGVPGYYYDDYGYRLDDYAGDNACFQYRHVYTSSGWQRRVWVCN